MVPLTIACEHDDECIEYACQPKQYAACTWSYLDDKAPKSYCECLDNRGRRPKRDAGEQDAPERGGLPGSRNKYHRTRGRPRPRPDDRHKRRKANKAKKRIYGVV